MKLLALYDAQGRPTTRAAEVCAMRVRLAGGAVVVVPFNGAAYCR